jgi:hypothetical protein
MRKYFCEAEGVAAYREQSGPGRTEYRVPADITAKSRPSPHLDHRATGKNPFTERNKTKL